MSIFCFKKLNGSNKEHRQLKLTREEKGLSIEELENITHIPQKYIKAIEEYRAKDLPGAKAFRNAYLKSYASALRLNCSCLIRNFDDMSDKTEEISLGPRPKKSSRSLYFILRNIGMAVFIFLFAGYIFWQVRGIIRPPELSIYSPDEGFICHDKNLIIQGVATKESRLTINGQDIMINEQGQFETAVDLTRGVNTIAITAATKHGKTSSIVRHVVMQEDNMTQVSVLKKY